MLTCLLTKIGNLEEAKAKHSQAIIIYDSVLGPSSLQAAQTLKQVALIKHSFFKINFH